MTDVTSDTSLNRKYLPSHSDESIFVPLVDARVLAAIVIALLALRIPVAMAVPPNSDEAFYWLWGEYLQWSYRDHGPLVGWVTAVSRALLGWSIFALRLPTLLTTALMLLVFWIWAGRLSPRRRAPLFWTATAVWTCSPLMGVVSTNVYPDHLLVPLLMLALTFLCPFLADWRAGKASYTGLYVGSVFLGLAGLAKYNAVFVGLALMAAIAFDPRLRSLLRQPQLYLAAGLSLFLVSPILIWNALYGFPTVALHAVERYHGDGFSLSGIAVIAGSILALSPLLLWPLGQFLFGTRANGAVLEVQRLGAWAFLASTGFMLLLVLWGPGAREFDTHWNVVAYVPFVLVAAVFIRQRWMLIAHIAAGGTASLVLAIVALTSPLPEAAFNAKPRDTNRYGLESVAAEAKRQLDLRGADFLAGPEWMVASRLSFAAGGDQTVTSISPGDDQFDLWHPGKELAGKAAIIVGRATQNKSLVLPFDEVEYLETVTATRFGLPVADYDLYYGRGYHPVPSSFDR